MKDVDASAVSWGLIIANCLSFFGSVNFGFALSWTAASLQNIANDESMPNFSQREQDWVSAMLTMGAMVGTLVGSFMSQRLGTYIVLVLTIFPASSGWASILFAQGISALIVGRALVGVCLGLFNTATPAFVAEITPPQFRGFMGGLYQIGIFFGIFLCLMISPYVSWRLLTAIALGISCIMSCGLISMKKTCERLMKDNKIPVLEQVLQSLSDSFNENEGVTGRIDDTSLEKPSGTLSILAALKKPEVYKPFILCSTISLGFQFSAVTVIVFYTIKMFTETGLSEDMAYVGSQCIGVTQLVLGTAGSFLALKLPRRPFFFFTAFLVTLGLASVSVCCLLTGKQTNSAVLGVAVICSFVFTQATFAVGYGTIAWAYIGELLPKDFEGLTIGSASLVNWAVSFFLTFFYHQMVELLNDEGVFFCFTFLFFFTTCLLVPWLPETKGKSLREIQAEFNSNTKSKHSEKAGLIADRKVPTNKRGYEIIPGKD